MAQTLFGAEVPAIRNAADGVQYSLGTRFIPLVNGTATHGVWYFPQTIPHPTIPIQIRIYRNDTQAILGTATFPLAATLDARNQVAFTTPIPLVQGVEYSVVILTPNRYVATLGYTWEVPVGDLTTPSAAGRFAESPGGMVFPVSASGNANYFADLVFVPDGGAVTEISVSDTGTGADVLRANAAVPLAETGAGADVLRANAAVPLSETGSGADVLRANAAVPLAETGTGADTVRVTAGISVTDAGAGADTVRVTAAVPLVDGGAAVDSLAVTIEISLSDTATGADAVTVTAAVPLGDGGAGVDTLVAGIAASLADGGGAADSLQAGIAANLSDTATGADALSVGIAAGPADTGTGTDTVTVRAAVGLSDGGSGTDTLSVRVMIALSDSGTGADTLQLPSAVPSPSGAATVRAYAGMAVRRNLGGIAARR